MLNPNCNTYFVQAADLKVAVDYRIIDYINRSVDDGVCNASEMQGHVNIFVKNMFGISSLPKPTNRRFYPSRDDLRQMIYRRRSSNMHGLLDQEMLLQKINEWSSSQHDDFWFYRQSKSSDTEQPNAQLLLVVYQSAWQRRLMLRYGQDLVFLDATYKTTQYAIPLFFLCVHTNDGYAVVAAFVMEHENSSSLSEALQILHEAVPEWNPQAFMIDASEMEASAIKSTFTGGIFRHLYVFGEYESITKLLPSSQHSSFIHHFLTSIFPCLHGLDGLLPIRLLHLDLSCAHSALRPSEHRSYLTQSPNVFLPLPVPLDPATSKSRQADTQYRLCFYVRDAQTISVDHAS